MGYAAGINRWTIGHQTFTEGASVHDPDTAAGGRKSCATDQLVNVGIACVIRHVLALKAGPRWAGDNFARLRLNIAEADFLVFFVQRQMGVIAPGQFAEGLPCFDRDLTVGFRRKSGITSEASMAVSMRGRPFAGPSGLT